MSGSASANPFVRVGPGDTALTVQPYFGGSSQAQHLVKLSCMPFVPAYGVWNGGGFRDELLTILIIGGLTARLKEGTG
jgi:hypothetical protein